ncbi:putative IQ motif, EF-hand binding protein [Helianthus anomalus]
MRFLLFVGGWLSAVKKPISHSDSSEKKYKKSHKKSSKKYWFGNRKSSRSVDKDLSQTETTVWDFVNLNEAKNEQSKHAYSVVYATVVAAEVAVAAAHAAAEAVRLTSIAHSSSKSAEEMVATKIQTAYRGHLVSRALRALRGLGRLRSVIQGQSVKRQTTSAFKCMQTLARVQS